MTSHSVDLDLLSAFATPSTCPGCGLEQLVPRTDRGVVTFACGHCARVWYAEAGTMTTLHRFPAMRQRPSESSSEDWIGA